MGHWTDPPEPGTAEYERRRIGRARRAAFYADTAARDARIPQATATIEKIAAALEEHGEELGLACVQRWTQMEILPHFGPHMEVFLYRGLSCEEPAFYFRIYGGRMVTEVSLAGRRKGDKAETHVLQTNYAGISEETLAGLWDLFKRRLRENWEWLPPRLRPPWVEV